MKRVAATRLILPVVVLALVVCAECVLGGMISGRVADTTDIGIQDVRVKAFDGGHNLIAWSTTDSSGTYTIADLPEGTYRIQFDGCASGYLPRWYNDRDGFSTADGIDVPDSPAVIGIDGTLSVFSVLFSDVPLTYWAEPYIAAIYCDAITVGCTQAPLNYCPVRNVNRQQMAAFIIRALFGEDFPYTPASWFTDVPDTNQFFKYIQKMKDEDITTGCNPPLLTQYCPASNVTRQAMAAFIIRALYGEDFTHTQSPWFTDVPEGHQFFKYIQKMKDEGITTGCTATEYCPGNIVNRAQMAAFLARAFVGIPMVTVPDVVGMEQATAEATIGATGLAVGRVSTASSGSVPAGSVISQSPAGGSSVAAGSAVTLVVSTGPAMVAVPDVVGRTEAGARSLIAAAGFIVGGTVSQYSESIPVGHVISQDPTAGTMLLQGSSVMLVLSLGPEGLPPDPSTVAPPVDRTVATTMAAATQFLYSGDNPIQTGVTANTIDARRAAVLRGRVTDRTGSPLPGVSITVLAHPEFGRTLSRVDGMFDMAVNGGGLLTVNYAKEGFLPVQRQVQVPWQDYLSLPDIRMIRLDTEVTSVDLTAGSSMQVARGSVVADGDGTRRGTVLVPQGTQAEIILPDGSTQAVNNLNVRITEYTVGESGPNAMPALLPPTSAYTYAFELSADEAVAKIAGKDVLLARPVYYYVENFLDFPAGIDAPVGYYDSDRAVWVPSDNGRVIAIVGETAGLADLDVDGDGAADTGAALSELGIDDAERITLANLYDAGQSLWRVPLSHFSTWDINWGVAPPDDATGPQQGQAFSGARGPDNCGGQVASVVLCQDQILGESIPVVGTPFTLNYSSDRAPGYRAKDQLRIPLTKDNLPTSASRVDLEVEVGGAVVRQSFPPAQNLSHTFEWDRRDVYGRTVNGSQSAAVRIGYVYPAGYAAVSRFGYNGNGTFITGEGGALGSRQALTFWQEYTADIGGWDARSYGLGGWTLNVQHAYDPYDGVLHQGDGGIRSAESLAAAIIDTVAGPGFVFPPQVGTPATDILLLRPTGIAVAPSGGMYVADQTLHQVLRFDADHVLAQVIGTGVRGYSGDGGPASAAQLSVPRAVTVGRDGSVYIAEENRVRRVNPDGIITTVAGTGAAGSDGDGGMATEAKLQPSDIADSPDGGLYIIDIGGSKLRRVDQDGIISTVAGTGVSGFSGDGGPAIEAQLNVPVGVDVAADGSIYIAESTRIRRVSPAGIIRTIAGNGTRGSSGDGGAALEASTDPTDVAVSADGSVYIAEPCRIRGLGPDAVINTVAGSDLCTFGGDGGPAAAGTLHSVLSITVGPDTSVYAADLTSRRIRRIEAVFPGFGVTGTLLADEDGSEVYRFNAGGQHLETLNALTGAVLYTFAYDAAGRILTITDGDNNATTIERDADGNPTAIVGPYGQRTVLGLASNGFLATITNPASETVQFQYSSDGLMTSGTDANGNASSYEYDDVGRLTRAQDAAGGFQILSRVEFVNGHEVTKTTALGRVTKYRIEELPNGGRRLINTFPDGSITETVVGTNGTERITYSDGSVATLQYGPDPRFGMQSPVQKRTAIITPNGITYEETRDRTVTLTNPLDPFSLLRLAETRTINGRTYTTAYDVPTNQIVMTSPGGRQSVTTIDAQGRIVKRQDMCCLHPFHYAYDTRGRVKTMTNGPGDNPAVDRIYNIQYDNRGFMERIIDPAGRIFLLENDPAGRIKKQIDPAGREILYTYDANGNMISITPPGRPSHEFAYNPTGLLDSYLAPALPGAGSNLTQHFYDLDRQLTQANLPDGTSVSFGYDNAGRLGIFTIPRGTYSLEYDPNSGNVKSVTAPDSGTVSFIRDGSNNLLTAATWSGAVTGSITQSYDNDFRKISRSVNGIQTVNFQYDRDGLLVQAGNLAMERNTQTGFIKGTTLGNVTTAAIDSKFGGVETFTAAFNGTNFFTQQYTYDALGRTIRKTETVQGQMNTFDYVYDLSGHLSGAKENDITIANYSYDLNGNRLNHRGPGGVIHGNYDDQDRLLEYGNVSYGYTANGELETKTDVANGTTSYQYDVLSNLTRVILPDGTIIEYIIDGYNRRIGKRINGVLLQGFLYKDIVNPIAEIDSAGNVISRFIYATRNNVPDYMIKDRNVYRIISDLIGSVRIVIDTATGTIVQRMDYDEFGNIIVDTNPGFQPFGFAGGIYDQHTKMTRFGTRDYDPVTGRWTTKDLILFDGGDTNLYTYVWNNPVAYNDPTGLEGTILCDVLFDTVECKYSTECHGHGWWVGWMQTQDMKSHTFPDGTRLRLTIMVPRSATSRVGTALRRGAGPIWQKINEASGTTDFDRGDEGHVSSDMGVRG